MKKGWVRKLWGYPVEIQVNALINAGVLERAIYVDGRGAEDFPALLMALRPGDVVCVAADLRVFGANRREILGITGQLEDQAIKIEDVIHPEDKRFTDKLDRALTELAKYNREKGSAKGAKRDGRRGGHAKRKAYEAKRAEVARNDVIQRIVDHPKLSWQDALDILGPPFTRSSLRRLFPRTK
jgi:hypothetical protein